MSYHRGEVVLVPFPFTDLSRQKARPAVVLVSLALQQAFARRGSGSDKLKGSCHTD